jgi:hypothetical protein
MIIPHIFIHSQHRKYFDHNFSTLQNSEQAILYVSQRHRWWLGGCDCHRVRWEIRRLNLESDRFVKSYRRLQELLKFLVSLPYISKVTRVDGRCVYTSLHYWYCCKNSIYYRYSQGKRSCCMLEFREDISHYCVCQSKTNEHSNSSPA